MMAAGGGRLPPCAQPAVARNRAATRGGLNQVPDR
jgi:hypothetical protein